jgi:dTDP-4-dehydrorhamnose 3,5-epimerase
MAFRFTPTEIPDVVLIEVDTYPDDRGFFRETYKESGYAEGGFPWTFVQANFSKSRKDVVRGLHFQYQPAGIGKLVSVTHGRILDVAADIRPDSPTYKRWVSAELSGENGSMLYVPPGFAHGFCALEDDCLVNYMMTGEYSPVHDAGVRWNDPEIGIEWPIDEPILSPKDSNQPFLNEIEERLRGDYETAEEAKL